MKEENISPAQLTWINEIKTWILVGLCLLILSYFLKFVLNTGSICPFKISGWSFSPLYLQKIYSEGSHICKAQNTSIAYNLPCKEWWKVTTSPLISWPGLLSPSFNLSDCWLIPVLHLLNSAPLGYSTYSGPWDFCSPGGLSSPSPCTDLWLHVKCTRFTLGWSPLSPLLHS